MSAQHRPVGIRLADRKDDGTAVVIAICTCGDVASTNTRHTVQVLPSGLNVLGSPSLDWPGHWHYGSPQWVLPIVDLPN